jgi:hypothetical protein
MARLLVFDDEHWRPDRIGEFSRFYSSLLNQTLHESGASSKEPDSAASEAIKAAYYSIMSGESSERAVEILNQLLPMQWKAESTKIVSDIRRAVSQFNPVEQVR